MGSRDHDIKVERSINLLILCVMLINTKRPAWNAQATHSHHWIVARHSSSPMTVATRVTFGNSRYIRSDTRATNYFNEYPI